MKLVDARMPTAVSSRGGGSYQPGIGPHSEARTVELVLAEMEGWPASPYVGKVAAEIRYPRTLRSRCDLCLGTPPEWDWAIEIKMLRLMGDNGKPNDNILMHILSPYPVHRSALTDCEKLLASGLAGRKGILIYGYDYEGFPMDPAIEAFEVLAARRVALSVRVEAAIEGLVHPIHKSGRVFGWEIEAK